MWIPAPASAGSIAEALDSPGLDFPEPPGTPWVVAAGVEGRPLIVKLTEQAPPDASEWQSMSLATRFTGPCTVSWDYQTAGNSAMQVAVDGAVLLASKSNGAWNQGMLNLPAGEWNVGWSGSMDESREMPSARPFLNLDRIVVSPGAVLAAAAALGDGNAVWAISDTSAVQVVAGGGAENNAAVNLIAGKPRPRLARLVTPQTIVTVRWKSSGKAWGGIHSVKSAESWKILDFLRSAPLDSWRQVPSVCGPHDRVIQFTTLPGYKAPAGGGLWLDRIQFEPATLATALGLDLNWRSQGWEPSGPQTGAGAYGAYLGVSYGPGAARAVRMAGMMSMLEGTATGPAFFTWQGQPGREIFMDGTAGALLDGGLLIPSGQHTVKFVDTAPPDLVGTSTLRMVWPQVLTQRDTAAAIAAGFPSGTQWWASDRWLPEESPGKELRASMQAGSIPPLIRVSLPGPALLQVSMQKAFARRGDGRRLFPSAGFLWLEGPADTLWLEGTPPGYESPEHSSTAAISAPHSFTEIIAAEAGLDMVPGVWSISPGMLSAVRAPGISTAGEDVAIVMPGAGRKLEASLTGPAILSILTKGGDLLLALNGIPHSWVKSPAADGWTRNSVFLPAGATIAGLSPAGSAIILADDLNVTPIIPVSLEEAADASDLTWILPETGGFTGARLADGQDILVSPETPSWLETEIPGPALLTFRYAAAGACRVTLAAAGSETAHQLDITQARETAPWQIFLNAPVTRVRFSHSAMPAGSIVLDAFTVTPWTESLSASLGLGPGPVASYGPAAWVPWRSGANSGASATGNGAVLECTVTDTHEPLQGLIESTLAGGRVDFLRSQTLLEKITTGTVPVAFAADHETTPRPFIWRITSASPEQVHRLYNLRVAAVDTAGFGTVIEQPGLTVKAGGLLWRQVTHPLYPSVENTWIEANPPGSTAAGWLSTEITGPASLYIMAENLQLENSGDFIGTDGPEAYFYTLPAGRHTLRWVPAPHDGWNGICKLNTLHFEPPPSIAEALKTPHLNWHTDDPHWVTFSGRTIRGGLAGLVYQFPNARQRGVGIFDPGDFSGGELSTVVTGPERIAIPGHPLSINFPFAYAGFSGTLNGRALNSSSWGSRPFVPGYEMTAFAGSGNQILTLIPLIRGSERELFSGSHRWLEVQVEPQTGLPPGTWVGAAEQPVFEETSLPEAWEFSVAGGPGGTPAMLGRRRCHGSATFTGPGRLSWFIRRTGDGSPWGGAPGYGEVRIAGPETSHTIHLDRIAEWQYQEVLLGEGEFRVTWENFEPFNDFPVLEAGNIRMVNDAFAQWSAEQGLKLEAGGILADPDGDGVVNLLEFIGNTAPRRAGGSGITIRMESTGPVLALPLQPALATRAVLSLEESDDLLIWRSADPAIQPVQTAAEIQFRVPPIPGKSRFLRLRAALPSHPE